MPKLTDEEIARRKAAGGDARKVREEKRKNPTDVFSGGKQAGTLNPELPKIKTRAEMEEEARNKMKGRKKF